MSQEITELVLAIFIQLTPPLPSALPFHNYSNSCVLIPRVYTKRMYTNPVESYEGDVRSAPIWRAGVSFRSKALPKERPHIDAQQIGLSSPSLLI